MPDIDRTADIKVIAGQGAVNAEIPLAGHASEHWLQIFHSLASKRAQELRAEGEDREDRTWVIVMLPGTLPATIQSRRWMRTCADRRGHWHG